MDAQQRLRLGLVTHGPPVVHRWSTGGSPGPLYGGRAVRRCGGSGQRIRLALQPVWSDARPPPVALGFHQWLVSPGARGPVPEGRIRRRVSERSDQNPPEPPQ
ncbi:unnamed protein product [Merluccius merluccius]